MSVKGKRVAVCTLGCRVNQYESNAIKARLQQLGFEIADFSEICDIYIINTCTVTAEADRKARNTVRRAVKNNPEAKVIVCGCYSQVSPDEVLAEGASYICGTRNKATVIDAVLKFANGEHVEKINIVSPSELPYENLTDPQTGRTRAYIKIEDGCSNQCTYCIIHTARGKACSRSIADIVAEARRTAESGFTETVCTGIETTAFGADTGEKLTDLIRELSSIPQIKRLRLGSVDPSYLRPDVAEKLYDGTKLMPHIHLSVQSGSDRILALMKRPYNERILRRNMEGILRVCPDMRFSADFIVGFPTETDEDFQKSLAVLRDYPFVHAHVFPYSKRKGTVAAEMSGQIPNSVKEERYGIFTALEKEKNEARAKTLSENRSVMNVLFESTKKGMIYGHACDFTEVAVPENQIYSGQYADVMITGYENGVLIGEIKEKESEK